MDRHFFGSIRSSFFSGQSDQVCFWSIRSSFIFGSIRSSFFSGQSDQVFFWSIRSSQSDQVLFSAQSDQVNPIRFLQVGLLTPHLDPILGVSIIMYFLHEYKSHTFKTYMNEQLKSPCRLVRRVCVKFLS